MRANWEKTLRQGGFPKKIPDCDPLIVMFKAEFICNCGFSFQETFQDTEVIKAEDLQGFYVRCPRCGEEAYAHSFGPAEDNGRRHRDGS
jgi:hypothetical protein